MKDKVGNNVEVGDCVTFSRMIWDGVSELTSDKFVKVAASSQEASK